MALRILIDEQIPYAKEAFSRLGEVRLMGAKEINRRALLTRDALIARSTLPITPSLLEGTPVRFVATTTAGSDHVDHAYLNEKGIGFASAPGSNAVSVAEYIVSALFAVYEERLDALSGKRIGIIGVGHVGKEVERVTRALGLIPVLYDPPLARKTNNARYRPIDALYECEIISLHTPLTITGSDATFHFADAPFFSNLRHTETVINTSRGSVIHSDALTAAIERGAIARAVVDVYENEPYANKNDIAKLTIATPHIAGHSFDGKAKGAKMAYDALKNFFGLTEEWDMERALPPAHNGELRIANDRHDFYNSIKEAARAVYDVRDDDAAFRKAIARSTVQTAFEQIRTAYRARREFSSLRVALSVPDEQLTRALRALGFVVS